MTTRLFKILIDLKILLQSEDGQDLIEYALMVALIAFGTAAGMQSLATGISNMFANVGNYLTNHTA